MARKEDPHLEEVESREEKGGCIINAELGKIMVHFHTTLYVSMLEI